MYVKKLNTSGILFLKNKNQKSEDLPIVIESITRLKKLV
jgi:hypothetical protein